MSTADGAINAEKATEVGREMQIKLNRKSVTSTMEVKLKVNALSSLREIPRSTRRRLPKLTQVVQPTANFSPKVI